jgi:hypothetical protein
VACSRSCGDPPASVSLSPSSSAKTAVQGSMLPAAHACSSWIASACASASSRAGKLAIAVRMAARRQHQSVRPFAHLHRSMRSGCDRDRQLTKWHADSRRLLLCIWQRCGQQVCKIRLKRRQRSPKTSGLRIVQYHQVQEHRWCWICTASSGMARMQQQQPWRNPATFSFTAKQKEKESSVQQAHVPHASRRRPAGAAPPRQSSATP